MYLNFYGLKKMPFHITPDPDFLFLSPSHKEALGTIIYGIEQRKGFVTIVGEVGTGKTTIIRSYLDKYENEKVRPIYILNSNMPFPELLKTFLRKLGINAKHEDVFGLVRQLQNVLVESHKAGNNIVLIIDEAQNMHIETLENLRMLSNLETTHEKLLQVILIGQPELEEKLNMNVLRQLKQRLSIRSVIKPLTKNESLEYIDHRLRRVTSDPEEVFKKSAILEIVNFSKGIPRVINIICDNCLVAGFGYQKKPITKKIVEEVIADYSDTAKVPTPFSYRKIALPLSAAVIAAITFGFAGTRFDFSGSTAAETQFDEFSVRAEESVAADTIGRDRIEIERKVEPPPNTTKKQSDPNWVENLAARLKYSLIGADEPEFSEPILFKAKDFPVIRVAREGDYITKLCSEVYGYSNEAIVGQVWQKNPWIRDINKIFIGDMIVFPAPNTDENKHL